MRVGAIVKWVSSSLGLLLAIAANPSAEAASFRITLTDGTEVVGIVQSFEDGIYRVVTPAGEKAIEADSVRGMEVMDTGQPAADASGAAKEALPLAEFTILTGDQQMVVGRLVSFEDGVYRISTKSGQIAVPVDKVEKIEIAWLQTPEADQPARSAASLSPGNLRIAGSNAMAEALAPALLEGFVEAGGGRDSRWSRGTAAALRLLSASTDRGKFSAEMRIRNSAEAVDALVRGEADIAMMSRQITAEEAQRVAAANLGTAISPAQEHVVAPGGAVVLIHPSNPVKALRLDQIADIFSGRVRSWSDIGGVPRRIQLYVPNEGAGVLSVFRQRVLGNNPLLATAKSVASSVEMAEIIAADPAAIGLVEFSHVGNAAALSIVDECQTVHSPSSFSLLTEDYPLSTRLYFYTPAQASPLARSFLDYALSGTGQQKIAERGLVSLLPNVDPQGSARPPATPRQGERSPAEQRIAADLAKLAEAASRVSVVFQFGFAAAVLDSRGEKDIDRLATFLKNQQGERRRVALVGFTDGTGPLENNVKLSERRAKLVAQKLGQQGITPDLVVGFGTLLPIACGASANAAAKNRRVEAWLY